MKPGSWAGARLGPLLFGAALLLAACVDVPRLPLAPEDAQPGQPSLSKGGGERLIGTRVIERAQAKVPLRLAPPPGAPAGWRQPADPGPPRRIGTPRFGRDIAVQDRPGRLPVKPGMRGRAAWQLRAPGAGGTAQPEPLALTAEECPPDALICEDTLPPPPPPDDTLPPPPPPPPPPPTLYYGGGSFVSVWGFGDYVDFGSYTWASEPVDWLYVEGYSFGDGWYLLGLAQGATNSTFVGVGWTYDAWWNGYRCWYEQAGYHEIADPDWNGLYYAWGSGAFDYGC